MIKSVLFVVADNIIRDANTNNMTVVAILENVHPDVFPVVLPRVAILLMLRRDRGDPAKSSVNLRCTVGADEIFASDFSVDFQGKLRTRTMIMIGAFPIPHPGLLKFRATMGRAVLGDYRVDVAAPSSPKVEASST